MEKNFAAKRIVLLLFSGKNYSLVGIFSLISVNAPC